jgi:hypothetical protein
MAFRASLSVLAVLGLSAAPASAAPLVEYTFDEGSGTNAANTGTLGAALDGTLTDGAGHSTDTPLGGGSSLALDGVNDFVRATTDFSYGEAFTVEAWIEASDVSGQRVIWDDYGNPGVLFAIFDGRLQFNISTPEHPGLGISVLSQLLLCAGEWIHVAGIYDGSAIRTYVNGVFTGDVAATTGAVIDNGVLASAIGADNLSTNALNFAGLIDDFRIHPTALDPSLLGGGFASLGHDCVPEPSLALLLGAGLIGLLGKRARANA